jgi:hypothetical protein
MKAQLVHIGDCAAVLPGFSTKGALVDEPGGTHQVVMAKHLTKGMPYVYDESRRLRINPDRDMSKYVLESGDILFMSRGTGSYAVILETLHHPSIAPSTFFVLKPQPYVVPAYLVWCLEQPAIQSSLGQMRTGAGTPMIPRQGFAAIRIPLPEKELQRRIADLWRLQCSEARLRQELSEETGRLARQLGQRIFESIGEADREVK